MSATRDTVLLFDAACLIAGAASDRGGSAFLIRLCGRGYLQAALSKDIVVEARRNMRNKFGELGMRRLERLFDTFDALDAPRTALPRPYFVNQKDVHVAEAALGVAASAIITLDKRHADEISRSRFPFIAIEPRTFIHTELRTHPDFPFAHH